MNLSATAEVYWQEKVNSGELDHNLKVLNFQPEEQVQVTLTLSGQDLVIIEDALHRRFRAVKNGRFDVIRAVVRIRNAMRGAMR